MSNIKLGHIPGQAQSPFANPLDVPEDQLDNFKTYVPLDELNKSPSAAANVAQTESAAVVEESSSPVGIIIIVLVILLLVGAIIAWYLNRKQKSAIFTGDSNTINLQEKEKLRPTTPPDFKPTDLEQAVTPMGEDTRPIQVLEIVDTAQSIDREHVIEEKDMNENLRRTIVESTMEQFIKQDQISPKSDKLTKRGNKKSSKNQSPKIVQQMVKTPQSQATFKKWITKNSNEMIPMSPQSQTASKLSKKPSIMSVGNLTPRTSKMSPRSFKRSFLPTNISPRKSLNQSTSQFSPRDSKKRSPKQRSQKKSPRDANKSITPRESLLENKFSAPRQSVQNQPSPKLHSRQTPFVANTRVLSGEDSETSIRVKPKRVSILRNSPRLGRTGMEQSSNQLSNVSNSKLALLATQASGFNTMPRDLMQVHYTNSINSSQKTFKFRIPAPTSFINKNSSKNLRSKNEEQENDTIQIAIMKMKQKKILEMKVQIQQMSLLNKFKKEQNLQKKLSIGNLNQTSGTSLFGYNSGQKQKNNQVQELSFSIGRNNLNLESMENISITQSNNLN